MCIRDRPYILKVDGCIHDGWLLIRDEEKRFDKRFLCFYLAADSTLAQYKKFAAGSCVNNLNSELVASVEIGIPPLEHQIYVANILEKIDKQVETATTMYELLKMCIRDRYSKVNMLLKCVFYSAERSQLLEYNPCEGLSAKGGKPGKKINTCLLYTSRCV